LIELFSENFLSKVIKRLIGNHEIDAALKRLDELTQEENQMVNVQTMEIANRIDNRMEGNERSWFPNRIHAGHAGSIILTGSQLQQALSRWLSPESPPDPSTNHNIALGAHHVGTAAWIFKEDTYKKWMSTGSDSLLWIHGKRAPCPIPPPDAT
jgi:hypothetical protein